MATYSSHRLIMGKEEIDNLFCLIGDILNFLYTRYTKYIGVYSFCFFRVCVNFFLSKISQELLCLGF